MGKLFTGRDLLLVMHFLYPDNDDQEPYEHPMTAVGVVFRDAALVGTTKVKGLARITGYSRHFISAIVTNMQNNKLWGSKATIARDGFLQMGTIDKTNLWEHIDLACGDLWLPRADTAVSADPCKDSSLERAFPADCG